MGLLCQKKSLCDRVRATPTSWVVGGTNGQNEAPLVAKAVRSLGPSPLGASEGGRERETGETDKPEEHGDANFADFQRFDCKNAYAALFWAC
jgi:hypothetical protein